MNWVIDKRTGIGFGTAMCMMVISLLLCAFFVVRGVLPENSAAVWVWISYGVASLLGGKVAAKGKGRRFCAALPAIFLYLLAWLLALSCKAEIHFITHGLGVTVAVVSGALLAFVTAGGQRKKRAMHKKKHPVAPRKRR